MKRVFKNLLVFALIAVISLSSFVFVSAEGNVNSSIIYFEAPDFWGDFDDVFCHIRPYGGEAFANWHSEVTKCTKVSDGVYAYDISKVCTIEKGKYYSVIFSDDNNNSTFDVILSSKCIGDTLYCDGNVVEEPTSSHCNTAYWKNTFPIMAGDTNLDGKVTVQDATKIQKIIALIDFAPEHWLFMFDTNDDTRLNIKDATEIQKWLAKLSDNDKIGIFDEDVTEPSTSATEDTFATAPSTEATADTEPVESSTVSTVPVESTSVTEPAETVPTESQGTEPASSAVEEEIYPDPYQKEVVEKFVEQGLDPAEEGMFYRVVYDYYKNATADEASSDEATPDYVLIWTSLGAVTDESYEVIIGDYALRCPGGCFPYKPGYHIYIPSTDTLMTIEEAYHANLEGLETVFEESGVFRPIEVDFEVIDEQRVSWYGSEETELFLLHHKSGEEKVISKFERGKAPEINIPYDEYGFCYDKIYLVSLNYLGGGNSTQTIDKITVMNGTLTVYRTITKPQNQTPDNNFQYVLIEFDESLLYWIYDLKDFTTVNIT